MKTLKKTIVILSLLFCCDFSYGFNLIFDGIGASSIMTMFTDIHFVAPGNDFGGAIFWLPTEDLADNLTIKIGQNDAYCAVNPCPEKKCGKRVVGLYYNSLRGNRVWPMDSRTLSFLRSVNPSYNRLTLQGGLFTTCEGDPYSVYGKLTYSDGGTVSSIIAGSHMDFVSNKLYSGDFVKSLQYFDNKLPLGFLYDTIGGVGFVGGKLSSGYYEILGNLNSGGSVNGTFIYSGGNIVGSTSGGLFNLVRENTGNAITTLFNIGVVGTVTLGQSISVDNKLGVLGNLRASASVFNAPNVNNSTLINQVNKNTSKLCKGLKQYLPNDTIPNNESVVCIQQSQYDSANRFVLDISDPLNYRNKTFVLKNTDIVLTGGMNNVSPVLNVFVLNGNVLLSNSNRLINFNELGYPVSSSGSSSGVYLKGNIIIDGLILGLSGNNQSEFLHKLYINGKFVSLNSPFEPEMGRQSQIRSKFGNSINSGLINLNNLFSWRCNPISGLGSDMSSCNNLLDKFNFMPLIIIDQNISSKMFLD